MKETLFFLFICISNVLTAQSIYFPPNQGDWDTLSAASQQYCPDKIDSLYNFLEDNNSKAFILLKNGRIILEKYFDNFNQDSIWYWASAGKTLTSALIGIAQKDGFLSLSDTTSTYLGQSWTSAPVLKEEKITIWNQLTMTTGLDDNIPNQDCTIDSCLVYLADAGSRWAYHNAPIHFWIRLFFMLQA